MRLYAAALAALVLVGGACAPDDGAGPARATTGRPAVPAPPPSEAAALGVKWDWDRVDAYASTLRELPPGDTFYELVWCDVERRPGARDWSIIDSVVDGAARLGFRMGLKIRAGSCWATGARLEERGQKKKTASLEPTDLSLYRAFVRAVVTRYAPRGVHAYAIENEVNGEGFWRSSPAAYERVARAAASEIRAADRSAVVVDSGISSTAYGAGIARWLLDRGEPEQAVAAYQRYYDRRFAVRASQLPRVDDAAGLEAALSAEQPSRNLAYLETSLRLAGEGVVDAWQLHFYERWDNVPFVLDYLRAHLPVGMPVEAWETGIFWPEAGGDEAALAGETAKVVSLLLAGGVRRVIWLPAANNPDGDRAEEVRWGLFGPDGTPRPAAQVYRDLATAAAGALPATLPGGSLAGVALAHGDSTRIILWSDAGAALPGPPPAGTGVRDAAGQPVPWDGGGLRVGDEPLFIDLPEPVAAATGRLT